MNSKLESIKNLFFLIKPQKRSLAVFTVIVTLVAFFETLGIGVLYPLISIFENKTNSLAYNDFINAFLRIDIGRESFVFWLFAAVMIFFLLRGLFIGFSYYYQNRFVGKLRARLQIKIFKKFLDQEYDYFIRNKTGDLIQRNMVHTEGAANALLYSCKIIQQLFTALVLYLGIMIFNFKAGLISTCVMAAVVLFYAILLKARIYVASQKHARLVKEAFTIVTEVLSGIQQVKAFLAEDFFKKRFDKCVWDKESIYARNATLSQVPTPVMQTFVLMIILGIIYLVTRGGGNLSLILIFAAATFRIISCIAAINGNFVQLAHLLPSVNIVSELFQLESRMLELPRIKRFEREIRFEDVDFAYSRKGFNFSGLNLTFEKGRFYGIVGPSGCGKSTLIDLILGFYYCHKGRILIDGQDIRSIEPNSWMKQIGFISQTTFVFNGTVEENISFAQDPSEVDRDKVIEAVKTADIYSFIRELPNGFQTMVGERGLALSGGQRQRLNIARAVYRDPEIYLFDEATSSLDTFSENKIHKSIEELSRSKTVISVAHRISSVVKADEIIVLKDGRVAEKGSHDELLKKNGFYSELYLKQNIVDPQRK